MMKGNPFSCLGSGVPLEDRPRTNMEKHNQSSHSKSSKTKQKKISHKQKTHKIYSKSPQISPIKPRQTDDQKQIPTIPSLNSAARSLLTEEPFVTSFINYDYQFVFRSRPIDSCKYEPYKILLLIASAHAFKPENTDKYLNIDPRLSPDGVSQCKIVSSALRKAKQSRPHLIYCSTLYRALSTMQLVCPDWYDDNVKIVALDQLRPQIINKKNKKNKRSHITELQHAFKNVSFEYVDNDRDTLWKRNKMESEDCWKQRIHEFLTKFLVPENELIKTQYGTMKYSPFENIGWNPDLDSLKKMNKDEYNDDIIQQQKKNIYNNKYTSLFKKRVVIVSHCKFFEYLLQHMMDDVSPQLCNKWKPCDLRKIFVYTKQQLGMNDIPYYNHSLIDRSQSQRQRKRNKKIKIKSKNKKRSRTPINTMSPTSKHTKSQSTALETGKIYNKYKNNAIRTTSSGDILMTNKSHNKYFPFKSHTFTLTSESAAILKKRHSKYIKKKTFYSRSANIYNEENKYNDESEDESVSEQFEDENKNDNVNLDKKKGCVVIVTPPNIDKTSND